MNQFPNPFINNMNYMGNSNNNPNNNLNNNNNVNNNGTGCGCNKASNGCPKPMCPTLFQECPPIVTCSKQVIDQYHVVKQPYVHNYHTEVVHHHVVQNEFIPNYTCSEVHVNEPDNSPVPRM